MKQAFSQRIRSRYLIHQVFIVGLTILAAVIILTPVVWMVNAALRPIKEVLTYPPQLDPSQLTFEYMASLIDNELYRGYFRNSVILALSTLVHHYNPWSSGCLRIFTLQHGRGPYHAAGHHGPAHACQL